MEVRWSNVLDAEFAETWSDNVVHDTLDWEKNNRELSRNSLSPEEKEEKQRAYWTEMERKRVEYYASKGKTPPSEKSFNGRIQESLARSEAHRAKTTAKEAERAAKDRKRAASEEEIKDRKEIKRAETEMKQKVYWAEMEAKRLEWYASQGKTPPAKTGYVNPTTLEQ